MPPSSRAPFLKLVYVVLAASFALVGLLFFIFPDGTVVTLNRVGGVFGFPEAPAMSHRFWLGLGTAYMAVVASLAALIAVDPIERRLMMLPLALGKAVSSGTCLLFFLFADAYFIYLANFLVDGGLVALVVWTYWWSDPAQRGPAAGGGTAGGASDVDATTHQILRQAAEALLPTGGAVAASLSPADVADRVVAHVVDMDPAAGPSGLWLLTRWLDVQPAVGLRRWRRFRNLNLDERVELLEIMERSRFLLRRQPALALKLLLATHAYRDPAVQAAIGVDRTYLDAKLAAAAARREAGGKGPYPQPAAPPPATRRIPGFESGASSVH